MVQKKDSSSTLFFVQNKIVLSSSKSLLRYNGNEWTVGNQEGLHLVALGDSLTCNCIIRFNIFFVSQTHLVQPQSFLSVMLLDWSLVNVYDEENRR